MRSSKLSLAPLALAALVVAPAAQSKRFAEAHVLIPAHPSRPFAIVGADVDGDGDDDLLLAAQSGPNRLVLGNGLGTFVDATASLGPQPTVTTWDIAVADVDGDGDVDAFFANNNKKNNLFLNAGAGTFSDATYLLPPTVGGGSYEHTKAAALGDVDGDGDPDALLANASGNANRLWLNDGFGAFTNDPAFPLNWVGDPTDALLADLDSDGDLDVTFVGNNEAVLVNDGAGGFAELVGALPGYPVLGVLSADAGDVDSDGLTDLLFVSLFEPLLYKNVGGAQFVDATAGLPSSAGYLSDGLLRDLDGDGDLDALMLRNFDAGDPDLFFVNAGAGVFSDASTLLPQTPHAGGTLFAEDLDDDGDVDAVLGVDYQSQVWMNDGAAGLADVTTDWPIDGAYTKGVALGDVDADGDLDALFANITASSLYRNGGRGNFVDVTASLGFALPSASAGALGDVDGDGAADALLVSIADSLYLADGAGGLLPAAAGLPADGELTFQAAFGDADGDGDLDAFLLEPTSLRL